MEKKVKRVLFIHINFYEYNEKIKNEIGKMGYELDCFCEDPKIGIMDKIIQKFDSKYLLTKSLKMQKKLIDSLSKSAIKYDYIFVIKGEKLQDSFLKSLKKHNPNAKFILYMWDDVKRVSSFFQNKDIYDEVYSFDRKNAEEYNLKFLPLFFCEEFRNDESIEKSIDVYFSGWEHSSRRQLIDKIIPVLKENNMSYYFHLYTGRWNTVMQKIKNRDLKKMPSYIKYNTLSLKENSELTLRSKILIDIHHPTQSGLTLRTIETLAAKSKLITTNSDIKNYDFYNANNIVIVNREEPIINPQFLRTPYENISEEIVNKYSLHNWVKAMLD